MGQFFHFVVANSGAFYAVFNEGEGEDNEDDDEKVFLPALGVLVTSFSSETGKIQKGFFVPIMNGDLKIYAYPESKQALEEIQSCHLSAAEAFAQEMEGVFESLDYYEKYDIAAWRTKREVHHFTVGWTDEDGVNHGEAYEWHELTFPDGSTLFVLPGDGPYLGLPSHLEPQREAALARKANALLQQQGKAADPALLAKLHGFQPVGPRN